MIKVSVIMPSLNVAAYIEKALQSVMKQTLQDIEIICIDAGSTDGTLEILEKYEKIDNRICLLRSEKRSYGYQVNMGITYAHGEYIGIVETDDYIQENMYELLYECAKQNDVDIVKGNYNVYWTQDNGEKKFGARNSVPDNAFYNKVLSPREVPLLASNDWFLWTGIYRKEFIVDNKIRLSETSGAAFQDVGFLCRTNVKANSVYYIEECVYNYCIDREDSSSNSGKAGEGMKNYYYEYAELLKEEWDNVGISILYARMARSFISCVRNINSDNIFNQEYREFYGWFVKQLNNAIELNAIGTFNLVEGIWKRLSIWLRDIDVVYDELKEELCHMEQMTCDINNNIIIFGAGERGHDVYRWLKNNGRKAVAYMDNSRKLWGTIIDEILVLEPKIYEKFINNTKYIVANETYYEEIREQLLQLGVREEDICIYW